MRLSATKNLAIVSLATIAWACTHAAPGDEVPAEIVVDSIMEVGVVPLPPEHAGRDVGFSGTLRGRSVWIFGDTFLPGVADDGLRWRSSSWSWTTDSSSEDGIGPFTHAVDKDGLAIQLLPHTSGEAAFNIAHESRENCPAKKDCGSRHTPWPNALVIDGSEQNGIIFYLNIDTGPGGPWDFRSVSGSVATWSDPDAPAIRVEPPLFSDEEPDWGSAAVLVEEDIYVYACKHNGSEKPCLLARVPFRSAVDRERYVYWAGNGVWSKDWRDAVPIFDGGSLFSVHYNTYLEKYLAFYMAGLGDVISLRTAPYPQGPWSKPQALGKGVPAYENWDYALIAHPEFSRDNGRVEILSYTRPADFLLQEIRLIEVRFAE